MGKSQNKIPTIWEFQILLPWPSDFYFNTLVLCYNPTGYSKPKMSHFKKNYLRTRLPCLLIPLGKKFNFSTPATCHFHIEQHLDMRHLQLYNNCPHHHTEWTKALKIYILPDYTHGMVKKNWVPNIKVLPWYFLIWRWASIGLWLWSVLYY